MTHDEKLAAVRYSCVKANPDSEWLLGEFGPVDGPKKRIKRPIRLTDVLLAIELRQGNIGFDTVGKDLVIVGKIAEAIAWWDFRRDSLDKQSEDCITFLFVVLCAA